MEINKPKRHWVSNPKGNPNIVNTPNTGAKTDEGKLRQILPRTLVHGQHSKLLEKFRKCNKCPFGVKKKTITKNGKLTEVIISASCTEYQKDKRSCPIGKQKYIYLLRDFYSKNLDDPRVLMVEIAKQVGRNAVSDAAVARDAEFIERAKPGFYSNIHEERALKAADTLNKILQPQVQRHLHGHVGDAGGDVDSLADKLVGKIIDLPQKGKEDKNENEKQKEGTDNDSNKNGEEPKVD